MTDALGVAERPAPGGPVVLIVEDRAGQRMDRARALVERGCVPITVEGTDSAARELTASPGIDLVLTDIHLVPREENDKSGVELARFVKADYPGIPVVGYSAFFSAKELPAEDLAVFDYQYSKGEKTIQEMRVILDRCVALATTARRDRREQGEVRLAEGESGPSELALEVLRSATLADVEGVEQVLHEAGFRLKLVKLPTAESAEPLIVWIREQEGYVDVEVYGHSTLYVTGATEAEALEQLIDLIHLFWEELSEQQAELLGAAKKLHEFLSDLKLNNLGEPSR